MPRFVGDRANYIDSKVIEHYNESFFNARETNQNIDISYKYYATAKFYPELSNSNFTIGSDTIIFKINGTESHPVGSNNINFEKVYLVDSLLQYSVVWGLKEGYFVSTHQIIITDENYNLKMIILFTTPLIVY